MTLWAITCYWNAAGFVRRLQNYHTFRENLAVPLLTVELSFTGEFELEPADAERLIRLQSGSVLWQKERLLNIAAQTLPDSCTSVAWLDADLLFGDRDWPSRAEETLQRHTLVQLFDRAGPLERGERSVPAQDAEAGGLVESTLSAVMGGRDVESSLRNPQPWSLGQSANGLAWAARREFFDAVALYDACILGSGDRALVCALLGLHEILPAALSLGPLHARHYLAWARRFSDWVGSSYSYLTGRIYHLWHGQPKNRRIEDRYKYLRPFGFDPCSDIELDSDEVWAWTTDKQSMREYVERYFYSRMDDD